MLRPTPRTSPFALRPRQAFTLVELLTVVAIIGVLAALVIGSVSKIRDAARRSQCSSNLRQIYAAFQLYAADNRGLYPAPRMARTQTEPYTLSNLPSWANPSGENWQVEISPYVIRGTNNVTGGGQTAGEVKNVGAQSNVAHCPSYDLLFDSNIKLTSQTNLNTAGYGMNYSLNVGGSNLNIRARFLALTLSNPAKSVLVADSSDFHLIGPGTSWPAPNFSNPMFPDGYSSGAPNRHGSSANYLFADGHVAALSPADALVAIPSRP